MSKINKKSVMVVGFAAFFIVSMVASSNLFMDASAQPSKKLTVPSYSAECSHGHNGFDCKTPQHMEDISNLEQRVTSLEKQLFELQN